MLIKFEVENFKCFKDKLVFDLTKTKNLEFNEECIKDKTVLKGIVYGANSSGKSNLGLAIMDITRHLTDSTIGNTLYNNYINGDSESEYALFKYTFNFSGNILEYQYSKNSSNIVFSESIHINDEEIIKFNREKNFPSVIKLKGTETLKTDIGNNNISMVKYVYSNSSLDYNDFNAQTFHDFYEFVNKMLFFRSLDKSQYIGLGKLDEGIFAFIIKNNLIKDFESFLNDANINVKLAKLESGLEPTLGIKFKNGIIPFLDIASSGTKALTVYYFFLKKVIQNNEASFIFIDEYDAYYHYFLSKRIISEVKKSSGQTLLTTHNTAIMNNNMMRPDCYFILSDNKIESLPNLTNKDIRKAHNLEKLYKAGTFDEK